MSVDLLADSLVERLRSNNLHAFEHLLTEYVLVQRSLDVRKTPNPQRNVEHEMWGVFLNGVPEHVIHTQCQEMHRCNASAAAMAVVEGGVGAAAKATFGT